MWVHVRLTLVVRAGPLVWMVWEVLLLLTLVLLEVVAVVVESVLLMVMLLMVMLLTVVLVRVVLMVLTVRWLEASVLDLSPEQSQAHASSVSVFRSHLRSLKQEICDPRLACQRLA